MRLRFAPFWFSFVALAPSAACFEDESPAALPVEMHGAPGSCRGPVWLVVRPQVATFTMGDGLRGVITDVAFRGVGHEYEITIAGLEQPIKVEAPSEHVHQFGESVTVTWPGRSVRVLPRRSDDD